MHKVTFMPKGTMHTVQVRVHATKCGDGVTVAMWPPIRKHWRSGLQGWQEVVVSQILEAFGHRRAGVLCPSIHPGPELPWASFSVL